MQDFLKALSLGLSAKLVLSQNALRFIAGDDTLVVTFLSAVAPHKPGDTSDDLVWAEAFLVKRGYSVLGVNRRVSNWYRAADLHQALNALKAGGFFARYRRVMFYGGSMGGFAALAFAELAPGCIVLAHNPQSTLRRSETPWETRYGFAKSLNWEGEFSDGVVGARSASKVYVSYDPFHDGDRRQVERLDSQNLVRLKVPMVGHQMARWLQKMRILGPVFESSLEGTLTSAGFREMARARFVFPHYLLELAKRVRHSALKQYLGEKVRLLDPNSKAAKAFLWGLPQVNAVRGKGNVRPILIFTFGVVADDEFLEQLRKTQPGARWADRPFTGHDKPYDLTVLFKNPTHKGMALDEVDRCLASHDVIVHQVAAKLTYFEFALLKAGRARGVDMVLFHRRQIEARPDELPPRPMVNLAERLATAGDRHFCVTANPLDDEQATSALTPLLHWLVAAA